jgi:catechol-2,3-dioxygenase
MAIKRLNHAVLYVRDARRHQQFYTEVLGFETMVEDPAGGYVFMRAVGSQNHHDIAFFTIGEAAADSEAGKRTVGLYHLAWEVPTLIELAEMKERLTEHGALHGSSNHGNNMSLYAKDPDGLEFEVMWLVPPEHWGTAEHEAVIEKLDIEALQRRFAEFGVS